MVDKSLIFLEYKEQQRAGWCLPPKRCGHVLILIPVNITLGGKTVFADVINLRLLRRAYFGLSGWAQNAIICVLTREGNRGEDQVKMETEIGMQRSQAKTDLETPEPEKDRK